MPEARILNLLIVLPHRSNRPWMQLQQFVDVLFSICRQSTSVYCQWKSPKEIGNARQRRIEFSFEDACLPAAIKESTTQQPKNEICSGFFAIHLLMFTQTPHLNASNNHEKFVARTQQYCTNNRSEDWVDTIRQEEATSKSHPCALNQ